MYAFTYERPAATADAAKLIKAGGQALAGGQTLLASMKQRLMQPEQLVDLGRIAELKGIKKKLFYWSVALAERYDNLQKGSLLYRVQLSLANRIVFKKWREALGGNVRYILTGGAA